MTPCGCEDGDYRDECWNNCSGGSDDGGPYNPQEGDSCPDGSGTHWDPGSRSCVPDAPTTGGGSCPDGMREGGPDESRCVPIGYDPPPFGAPTGQGGGGGYGGGGPKFTGSSTPKFNIPPVPKFVPPPFTAPADFVPPEPFQAPGAFKAPKFTAPGADAAENEPGYQFRRDQGIKGLEASAAARGTLNTGGTLKGIVNYGQQLASQEYGNVYNRALQAFDRLYMGELDSYKTQYTGAIDQYDRRYKSSIDDYDRMYRSELDAYDKKYTGAKDAFAPLLAEWQLRSTANIKAAELAWQREWDRFLAELDLYKFHTPSASDILNAGSGD